MEEGRIQDMLSNLFNAVKMTAIKHTTMRQAVSGDWWRDVSPNMSAPVIQEFLLLSDQVGHVELSEGIDDKISW